MGWFRKRSNADLKATRAEINKLASELQVLIGGRGSFAMTVLATALANEAAAAVMRTGKMDEMLDMTCEAVRGMARYTANPSADAPKEPGDLTEQEFAQLPRFASTRCDRVNRGLCCHLTFSERNEIRPPNEGSLIGASHCAERRLPYWRELRSKILI
jgi:hypothetical protein